MNMYTVEQRVFIVCEYWRTGSFKQCQRAFRNKYGEESVPTKSCIHKLVKKTETTGSVLTQHAGGRKVSDRTVQDVKDRLLASPRKSLRKLSQEIGVSYSTCQRAAKKAKLQFGRRRDPVAPIEEVLLKSDLLDQSNPDWNQDVKNVLDTTDHTQTIASEEDTSGSEEPHMKRIKSESLQDDELSEDSVSTRVQLSEKNITNTVPQPSTSFVDVPPLVPLRSSVSFADPTSPSSETSTTIEGNRIVTISYFFEKLQKVFLHTVQSNDCSLHHMKMISEESDGLLTELTIRCLKCKTTFIVSLTDPDAQININKAAVYGAALNGMSYSGLKTFLDGLGVPYMSEDKFESISNEDRGNGVNTVFIKEEIDDTFVKEEDYDFLS